MKNVVYIIISGGIIEDYVLSDYINSFDEINKDSRYSIIAVDRGLETLNRLGLHAEYIVGDFDTVNQDILNKYRDICEQQGTVIKEYKPEKNLTDTHIALELAIEKNSSKIVIFGATGGRIDHLLSNIALISIALDNRVSAEIIDANNRIYMTDKSIELNKSELYGKYVSLLAYNYEVNGVTLKGFKYPLTKHRLIKDDSLGISNEVMDKTAQIEFKDGRLVIIESKD